jgi:uncharacterized protein YbaR (Trm112 family)
MFCPNDECPDYLNTGLRSEYFNDVIVCPYCEAPLVAERPSAEALDDGSLQKPRVGDDEAMEPVIEANDLTEVAVIKSVLDAAGIPYLAHGEQRFGAFRGAFVSGSIFNPGSRGVVFTVPSRMAEEARILLEEFDEEPGGV